MVTLRSGIFGNPKCERIFDSSIVWRRVENTTICDDEYEKIARIITFGVSRLPRSGWL